jgi:two-component system, response regulator YesN
MIKLFIAEDEASDREILLNNISWSEIFVEPIGYAEDGGTAYDLICQYQPDIVLTDIKMPVKSGIELANMTKQKFPDIKIIFISAHQDFEYAKEGIRCQVVGYISKPIDLDEVHKILKDTAQQCLDEKSRKIEDERFRRQLDQSLPLLKERFFRDLIFGMMTDNKSVQQRMSFLGIGDMPVEMLVMAVHLDDFSEIRGKDEYGKELVDYSVLDAINEIIGQVPDAYALTIRHGEYAILLPNSGQFTDGSYVALISGRILNNIAANCRISCTIGIGGVAGDCMSFPRIYKNAVDAVQYRFYYGKGTAIFYKDLIFSNKDFFNEKDYYKSEIIKSLKIGDEATVAANLDELFTRLSGNRNYSSQYIRGIYIDLVNSCLNSLIEIYTSTNPFDDVLFYRKLVEFEVIFDIHKWVKDTLLDICGFISKNTKKKNAWIVENIRNIINSEYDRIVSVEEIANRLYLSAGYAGTVFKNETGSTIINYLTAVRMDKAIDLLKSSNMKIQDIAQKVSYKNVTHFCCVFKNRIGLTPSEYRGKFAV